MSDQESDFSLKSLFFPLTTYKAIPLIIVVGFIVFSNSFFNGFVGDDDLQILQNVRVHSLSNIPTLFFQGTFDFGNITGLYYKPLLSTFFTILYVMFGPNAFPFHFFQVSLHGINAIVVFLIFRYFFNKYLSLVLALIFLVHPINAESVVYISNLQDILFFFFGSLAFYIELQVKNRPYKNYIISILLLCSLFSKETGILFIVLLLVYKFLFNKKLLKPVAIMYSLVFLCYLFFRVILAHFFFGTDSSAPIFHASWLVRLLTFPSILSYYFLTFFYPNHLAIAQQWLVTQQTIAAFYKGLVVVGAIITALFLLGRFIHKNNHIYFLQYLFFTFVLSVGLLFHANIFFALDSTVADRWFYFPILGLLGIIGTILQVYSKKILYLPKSLMVLLVILILSIFSIRTMIRNTNFVDNYTLYSHDVQFSKESSLLESGLGGELMDRGQYAKAEPYLLKSVQLDPEGLVVWNTLGMLYQKTGEFEKAKNAYRKAIINGSYYEAYQNIAILLIAYNQLREAEKYTREGLQKYPANGTLWQLFALVEHELGHKDKAMYAAKHAVLYNPSELTNTIYTRLSQNLSLNIVIVSTGKSKNLFVCPPACP